MSDTNKVEDLPEWAQTLVRDLRAEAATARVKNRDDVSAAELAVRTQLDADYKSKLTALESKLTESETRATNAELAVNQFKGAIHAGVPADRIESFAPRLRGATLDEIKSDATAVAESFGVRAPQPKQRAVDNFQGQGGHSGEPTEADAFADFLGSSLGWTNN